MYIQPSHAMTLLCQKHGLSGFDLLTEYSVFVRLLKRHETLRVEMWISGGNNPVAVVGSLNFFTEANLPSIKGLERWEMTDKSIPFNRKDTAKPP